MSEPLLAICVPTYNRRADVERLLACLDEEIASAADTVVLVSDNGSEDGTWQLLLEAAESRSWLRLHRQPENLGAVGNLRWLVEHAPPCEYLWSFGDDDLIVPGGLRMILSALRDERPAWLFLPHIMVDEGQREVQRSPAPGRLERFASAGDLYKAYHHWLTFLTASIVRRGAFQEAVSEVRTENAYIPLLWFFRAGLDGPCAVAPAHVVTASQAISWADRAHDIQTKDFTALWDDGLCAGLTEEEFGATLDGLYTEGWGLHVWRRQPVELLASTVARFPQSRTLRAYLWTLAREQRRADTLPALDDAARRTGDDALARELVEAGEAAFADGDAAAAATRFAAAARLMPTDATAWNDLAVALHQLGEPAAATQQLEAALFARPDDVDARANLAALTLRA